LFTQDDVDVSFKALDPRRELIVRSGLGGISQQDPKPTDSSDEIDPAVPGVTEQGKQAHSEVVETSGLTDSEPKPTVWDRAQSYYTTTYAPFEEPSLILPTAPTDSEKTLYLKTNRIGLYSFGVTSFLSLSAGMWLFVISSPVFYWFGLLVILLQIYLVISYTVSIFGKDYDYAEHCRIVRDNPIDPQTCPTVDIYLPCCKEPMEVLENTYKHVQKLQWPEGKLKVYVLDDGASDAVKALAEKYGYTYFLRDDRPRLKKAGNLRWAFARTTGDFFNIYDAVSLFETDITPS